MKYDAFTYHSFPYLHYSVLRLRHPISTRVDDCTADVWDNSSSPPMHTTVRINLFRQTSNRTIPWTIAIKYAMGGPHCCLRQFAGAPQSQFHKEASRSGAWEPIEGDLNKITLVEFSVLCTASALQRNLYAKGGPHCFPIAGAPQFYGRHLGQALDNKCTTYLFTMQAFS